MSKFHINRKGVPAPCRATKSNCPFGGAEVHFDTVAEAEVAATERMTKEYGIFTEFNKERKKLTTYQRKDIAKIIDMESSSRTRGLTHECFATVSLAEEMGLEKIAVVTEDGSVVNISMDKMQKVESDNSHPIAKATDILSEHYEEKGVVIKNKDSLIRVVYYSEDPNKGILVQTGSPNVLDAAIIKNGKVEELIEIKELGNGAQLSSKTLAVDKDGYVKESALKGQSKYIKEILSDFNVKDAEGSNTLLDFGGKIKNQKIPLFQFIRQYRQKGATSLLYVADKGNVVNMISLNGSGDDVAKELVKNKIEAELNMRANQSTRKLTEDDHSRLVNDKELFREDVSQKESFTLSSVNPKKITKSRGKVKIGNFLITSIDYKDYKLNMDKEIPFSKVEAFNLLFTGKIVSKQTEKDLNKLRSEEEE